MTYKSFDDWYNELEGFTLRCERFLEDVDAKSHASMEGWLRTAWELGAESAAQTSFAKGFAKGFKAGFEEAFGADADAAKDTNVP